jgi:predicted GNAT superfamily acetyltransferase
MSRSWTFDPMVARSAAFNLRTLGATGVRFLAARADSSAAGQPDDRIEVVWDLAVQTREAAKPRSAILVNIGGVPGRVPPGEEPVSLAVPADYDVLCEQDPQRAAFWRDAVRGSMSYLFGKGYHATGFDPEHGYLFTRRAEAPQP